MRVRLIVVDTNKLLAAILRPGKIRRLLFTLPSILLTPSEAWREIEEHAEELATRKGIPRSQLHTLLEEIRREVVTEVMPEKPYVERAKEISREFDPDDWPFIALALQYNAPIWTNDKNMIRTALKTRSFRAVDTRGVEMLLEGKPWREVEEYLAKRYSEL